MDITNEQIEVIFKRQVRQCRGIGEEVMHEIVHEQFADRVVFKFDKRSLVCGTCDGRKFIRVDAPGTTLGLSREIPCPDCKGK